MPLMAVAAAVSSGEAESRMVDGPGRSVSELDGFPVSGPGSWSFDIVSRRNFPKV